MDRPQSHVLDAYTVAVQRATDRDAGYAAASMERVGLHGLDERGVATAAVALGAVLQPGDVLLLEGPMGAGKTTFTRALAEGLAVRRPERVRSPTYNLCLIHDGPRPLVHVDLFRLAQTDEGSAPVGEAAFESLGLDALGEGLGGPEPVLVVEWADLWAAPPADHLRIRLQPEPDDHQRRTLIVNAHGSRAAERLAAWQPAAPA
ncbi:MAG: tRNA (adenosine(37)-N6)-threonylcarbamoyltransferase complex ATPase subunit type 1 TsaE [Myxococcota bacterium]